MGVPFAVTHRLRPWRVGVCCHVEPMRAVAATGRLQRLTVGAAIYARSDAGQLSTFMVRNRNP